MPTGFPDAPPLAISPQSRTSVMFGVRRLFSSGAYCLEVCLGEATEGNGRVYLKSLKGVH